MHQRSFARFVGTVAVLAYAAMASVALAFTYPSVSDDGYFSVTDSQATINTSASIAPGHIVQDIGVEYADDAYYQANSHHFNESVADTVSAPSAGVAFGLIHLSCNTLYYYRVYATSDDGAQSFAPINSFTTTACTPGPPTITGHTSGINQIELTWNAPDDNGGASISDYIIYYDKVGSGVLQTFDTGSNSTSAIVAGLDEASEYEFQLTAVNVVGEGNATIQNFSTIDGTVPTVTVTAPTSGDTVPDNYIFSADASDNVAVDSVLWYVNGVNIGHVDGLPYDFEWDASATSSGIKSVVAVARDTSSLYATSTAVSFTLDRDPPSVSVTAPASGATVSTNTTLTANASDALSTVAGVSFYIDGVRIGSEDTTAPYSVAWDASSASAGTKSIVAAAHDSLGNYATSTTVTVTVPAPASNNDSTPAPSAGGGGGIVGLVGTHDVYKGPGYVEPRQQSIYPDGHVVYHDTPLPVSFNRTLELGAQGSDVLAFQQFLNTHGSVIATKGPGAPGNETTYFGSLTKTALIKFQEANAKDILVPLHLTHGTGVLGPSTLAFIRQLLKGI
ncbi:MAG TPA: Ig-like domain-containing protein [Candidatus Paceibacterota bacterium]|nr:Ig-like domain-containing protein [Candidatus Paceibacterota bacterium]